MQDNANTSDKLSFSLTKGADALVDGLKMTGRVRVEVRGPDGALKDFREISNLVVTAGKAHIASLLKDKTVPAEMTSMALGTGVTSPSAGDTDLQSEITTGLSGTRVSITRTNPTSVTVLYASTWTAGQATNGAITEAGILNASAVGPASGTMLARATFTAIPKGASDSLSVAWTLTIS